MKRFYPLAANKTYEIYADGVKPRIARFLSIDEARKIARQAALKRMRADELKILKQAEAEARKPERYGSGRA